MQLPIRDASRFIIGASVMRDKTIAATGQALSFEHVAQAALRGDAHGEETRKAINYLADDEAAWLRNTPPHTLSTEKVLESRRLELEAFKAMHEAVLSTFQYGEPNKKADHEGLLTSDYVAALNAIDNMPGSKHDRRSLLDTFKDELASSAPDPAFALETVSKSERAALEDIFDGILSHYLDPEPLHRSDDYDLN